jgi:hypothetical protein
LQIRIILSEVKTLSWVNLTTDCHLKVFVRDLSITVSVKFIEEMLELLLSNATQAPVLKIEPEFLGLD